MGDFSQAECNVFWPVLGDMVDLKILFKHNLNTIINFNNEMGKVSYFESLWSGDWL